MTTPRTPVTRRRALAGVTGVGLALPVLAACGDDSTTGATDPASSGSSPATSPSSSPSSSATSSDPTGAATSAAPGGTAGVVSTADVPVGSGVILTDEQVVVTQPTEGDVKVFSAICTHTGCPVGSIEGAVISCPCHGSTFDAATGAVLGGPAPAPLPAVDFTVEGDQVVLS